MSLRLISVPAPRRALAFLALGLFGLGACATHVQNTTALAPPPTFAMPKLPPPHKVYVTDFVVDPATLKLDSGVRARLQREFKGDDHGVKRHELTREVQTAISDTLVQAFNAMGLKTELVAQGTIPPPGNVVVRGEIVKITAGNQTRRTLIGFGAGASEIYATVALYGTLPNGSQRLLQTYDASANSGRAPGLGIGAASAAAGHVGLAVTGAVAGTVSRAHSSLGKDAEDLGKRVATNLGQFFESQGWIAK
jgi:hypothetical protein